MAGTIQEIAERAGVSRGTVDRALNNRGRINPEVAEKILQIAAEIGYQPRKRKKRTAPTNLKIGIVTQLANSSFMVPIRRGLQDAMRELANRHIECLLKEIDGVDEDAQIQALEALEAEKVQAIALMPVESQKIREKINQLVTVGIPVITFNSDIVGSQRKWFIGLDNQKSGRTAAGLMGMLTHGSGKVLAITGFFGNSVSSMRVDGFVEKMKESYPAIDLVGVQSSFDNAEEVEKIILNALAAFPDLSGLVIFSGGQSGVQSALAKLKLKQRPYIIIYDLTKKNIKALKADAVDFLIDQDGYTQGYRALLRLADELQDQGEKLVEFQYTDINIKTQDNV